MATAYEVTEFARQGGDPAPSSPDFFNIPRAVAAAEADSKIGDGYIVIRDVNIFRYRAVKNPRATPKDVSSADVVVRRVRHEDVWYDPSYLDNLEEGVLPVGRSAV